FFPNKAPPKTSCSRRQKNPPSRVIHCHAPDAVRRKYRGKITARKEYFASGFVLRRDCAKSLFACSKCSNFWPKIGSQERGTVVSPRRTARLKHRPSCR